MSTTKWKTNKQTNKNSKKWFLRANVLTAGCFCLFLYWRSLVPKISWLKKQKPGLTRAIYQQLRAHELLSSETYIPLLFASTEPAGPRTAGAWRAGGACPAYWASSLTNTHRNILLSPKVNREASITEWESPRGLRPVFLRSSLRVQDWTEALGQ